MLGATDRAVVALPPDDLNLGKELSAARKVLLATAFARTSGWKLLKRGFLSGSAELSLLTGLDFLQTGPDLLREWLGLTKRYSRIKAKTASRDSIFHPKVLIVKANSPSRSFAIVGSGNLTGGGLRTNTECSLYTSDHATVLALERWFDEAWKKGTCLTTGAIRKYEPKYKKAKKAAQRIRNEQKKIQKDIEEIARKEAAKREAILRLLKEAVTEFNSYRKKAEFESQYRSRRRAVALFRRLLHVPSFDFTKEEFAEFYKAPQLGSLRERWLRDILKRPARLKSGLRYLIDEGALIEERVNSFLEKKGRHHIPGFNIAGVSKVLAVAHSNRWPVLNGPVRKTLSHFQYESPHGTAGERYRQFAELARKFKAPDFLALDAFFKHKEGELKRSDD
jgi:HKD family nuclease